MSKVNLYLISKINKELFIRMLPNEQFSYVLNHTNNAELLKELYPHAKDDFIRLEIVKHSKDKDLAKKLFESTKYPVVKASLVEYIDDKDLLREMFVTYIHSPETLKSIMSKLSGAQNRALLQSMRELDLLPEEFSANITETVNRNPITD